jgi:hypothetical protein
MYVGGGGVEEGWEEGVERKRTLLGEGGLFHHRPNLLAKGIKPYSSFPEKSERFGDKIYDP